MKKRPIEIEWDKFKKKEHRYKARRMNKKRSKRALEKIVPIRVQNALASAFHKGFEAVFSEGNFLIGKTVSSKKHKTRYETNSHKLATQQKRKNIRAFRKRAKTSNQSNILLSGAEGFVLGLLGIGVPDIPIFIGNILKSLYQIALDFGYDYSSEKERIFVLKLIQAALQTGSQFANLDAEVDALVEASEFTYSDAYKKDIMKEAANALSDHLLYAKFIQGIPVVGVTGGVVNMYCMNRITKYAALKYEKRFLSEQLKKKK